MSIYNRYIVRQGDTLQKIAYYKLGAMEKWLDLRDINNLEYPYIVSTPDEKLKNPEHLLTTGDILYLPKFQKDVNEDDIKKLAIDSYSKDQMYDTVLGRDLAVETSIDDTVDETSCILYSDDGKDLATKNGLDNLYQSLIMRIFTRKGALLLHPEYGSTFIDFIGKPLNYENIKLAGCELSRAITEDARVDDCKVTYQQLSGDSVSFLATVTPVSEDKSISLYISIMEDGRVILS